MAWRVHLSNRAIQHLDILEEKSALLAVWADRSRVFYFDLETGATVGEDRFEPPDRHSEQWRTFLTTLVAPNSAHLPFVRTPQVNIYTTKDGRMRLYQSGEAELIVEIEERLIALRPREQAAFVAVGLDRLLGLVAALDENGRLHIFQQHVPLGVFELGLMTQGSSRPAIVVADGGATIFVTDGASLVLTNPSGQVRKRLDAYYWIGRIACSPDGRLLVASDLETGVVRVYDGDLTPTRQRHAFDLVAAATQVQLMADLPPEAVAVGALALNNAGVLALALSGVICVTDVEQMDALPRPAPLF